jgi:Na+-driven multidrug efflux pump
MTRIGLPAGIQGSLFSIANVTIQSVINSFGSSAVAGNATSANIEGFVFVIVNCIAQGVLTFTGQNFGAGKISRIKKGIFTGLGMQAVLVMSVAIIVNIFAKPLAGIYTDDPEVIGYAVNRLQIICMTYFICGFNEVFVAGLRGLGSSTLPMITSIFGICGLRLVYIATVFTMYRSLESLYITYPLSWIITGAVNGILLMVLWKKLTQKN